MCSAEKEDKQWRVGVVSLVSKASERLIKLCPAPQPPVAGIRRPPRTRPFYSHPRAAARSKGDQFATNHKRTGGTFSLRAQQSTAVVVNYCLGEKKVAVGAGELIKNGPAEEGLVVSMHA